MDPQSEVGKQRASRNAVRHGLTAETVVEPAILRDESRGLERRLAQVSRYGLNFRERQYIEIRIARLEQRVRYEASDGNRWVRNGYNGYNGYNNQYAYDRDRDD